MNIKLILSLKRVGCCCVQIYTHYFSLAAAGSKGEGEIEIKSNKIELIRSEKICPFKKIPQKKII